MLSLLFPGVQIVILVRPRRSQNLIVAWACPHNGQVLSRMAALGADEEVLLRAKVFIRAQHNCVTIFPSNR